MVPCLLAAVRRAAPRLAAAEAAAEQKQVPALQLQTGLCGWQPAEIVVKCAAKSNCSACWPCYPFCRATLRLQLMTSGRSMRQQQWATSAVSTRWAAPAVPVMVLCLLPAVPAVRVLLLSRSFASCMRKPSHAACAFESTPDAPASSSTHPNTVHPNPRSVLGVVHSLSPHLRLLQVHMNHSRGRANVRRFYARGQRRISFFTTRDVQPGEELLYE